MKRTYQPEPSMHDRRFSGATKPRAIHTASGRVTKRLRSYTKRYSHALTEYFTQKNRQRIEARHNPKD